MRLLPNETQTRKCIYGCCVLTITDNSAQLSYDLGQVW